MALPTTVPTINAAGTNAATATPLAAVGPIGCVCVNGGTGGVILPPHAYANSPIAYTIFNTSGQTITIYPGTGGSISTAASTGQTSVTLATATIMTLWCFSPVGDWVVH